MELERMRADEMKEGGRGGEGIERVERCFGVYLFVNNNAKSGLSLDDGIRNTHFAAECWEKDDQLYRVNVIGDEN